MQMSHALHVLRSRMYSMSCLRAGQSLDNVKNCTLVRNIEQNEIALFSLSILVISLLCPMHTRRDT